MTTVHRIWIQGYDNMPDHLKKMNNEFNSLNPDLDFEWWSDEEIHELDLGPAEEIYLNAEQYVPVDSVNQLKADIARYAILSSLGGVTIDVDYYWFKPITGILNSKLAQDNGTILAYEVDKKWVACGFMVALSGHPLYGALLEKIAENAQQKLGRGLRANSFTGPKFLTRVINGFKSYQPIGILPAKLLHSVPWNQAVKAASNPEAHPDAIAVHAWSHQRGLNNINGGIWKTW